MNGKDNVLKNGNSVHFSMEYPITSVMLAVAKLLSREPIQAFDVPGAAIAEGLTRFVWAVYWGHSRESEAVFVDAKARRGKRRTKTADWKQSN